MSEEIPNPGKVVPEIMTVSVVIGSVTGFIMCVALLFAAPDMDQVISAPEGPILHILRTCTGSDAGAIVLVMFPLVCLIMSNTGMITSASRLTYAFARDGGLPYSSTLAKVHKGLDVPLNALGLTMAVVTVYGLLFFAGTAAMNALVSGSVVLLGLSYIVPVVVNMASGRRGLPEDRPFRMGNKVAWAANSVGVGYVLLTTVLFCLPPGGPEVEKDTMSKFLIWFRGGWG